MLKKLWCFGFAVLSYLLLLPVVSAHNHGNPAKELVDMINKNRTAQKLPQLKANPGLGCMALQYAQECKGNCTIKNTFTCDPPEDDFTEVFAPNCGVELPTFSTISGQIMGCESKYIGPSEAFSGVLVRDKRALNTLRNKTHTEVGVGLMATHKGHFVWCVLFSNGQTNSSFVLEDRGLGIKQKKGCFSGTSLPCSGGQKTTINRILNCVFSSCSLVILFGCFWNLIFYYII